MRRLRRWSAVLARTPLHPQWLLGPRRPPMGIGGETGTVLDIGAADEWIRPHLHPLAHYVSMDYPTTGQALYNARPLILGDASQLPFAGASCDAVICLEVLEHVPTPELVLREIGRVLRPGGRAYLSMPFLYPIHDAPYDFSRFTEFGWRQHVRHEGFSIQKISKRTHSLRTAGLLACLALTAPLVKGSPASAMLLPLLGVLVLMINLLAFSLSLVIPDWSGMGSGYELVLGKD